MVKLLHARRTETAADLPSALAHSKIVVEKQLPKAHLRILFRRPAVVLNHHVLDAGAEKVRLAVGLHAIAPRLGNFQLQRVVLRVQRIAGMTHRHADGVHIEALVLQPSLRREHRLVIGLVMSIKIAVQPDRLHTAFL